MSYLFQAGASAATNPNLTYEPVGWDTGSGTTVTAGATSPNAGSWIPIGSTTAAAWSGFLFYFGFTTATSINFTVEISFDNGTTTHIPSFYVAPSTTGGYAVVEIPMQVPAGSQLAVRVRSSNNAATALAAFNGILSGTGVAPGYTTCTAVVAADNTNIRASTVSVSLTTGATSWTTLIGSTAAQYGAFIATASPNGTPGGSKGIHATMASGANPSEVAFANWAFTCNSANPLAPRAVSRLMNHTIASSQRLSINLQNATVGAPDAFYIGLLGFS